MEKTSYYEQLKKPRWVPPSWLFGPVWFSLYVIILFSYGYAAYLYFRNAIPFIVLLPFILNLIFNFLFTPIQFRLKKNGLAAIDILLTIITLLWALYVIYPYANWVSFVNIPYALWVIFAAMLQLTITFENRKKHGSINNSNRS